MGEIPALDRFYRDNKGKASLLIVAEWGDTKASVKEAMGAKSELPVLLDSDDQIGTDYRVDAVPTEFFIDTKGGIAASRVGSMSAEEMEEILSTLQ